MGVWAWLGHSWGRLRSVDEDRISRGKCDVVRSMMGEERKGQSTLTLSSRLSLLTCDEAMPRCPERTCLDVPHSDLLGSPRYPAGRHREPQPRNRSRFVGSSFASSNQELVFLFKMPRGKHLVSTNARPSLTGRHRRNCSLLCWGILLLGRIHSNIGTQVRTQLKLHLNESNYPNLHP